MSRYYSYLNSAKEIINSYKGIEPFSVFLKKKFAQEKKYGSKDRKQIAHLCYCFFRLGRMAMNAGIEERIIAGLFLSSAEPNELLQHLKPEWNEKAGLDTDEKITLPGPSYSLIDVFPWKEKISKDINHDLFCRSFFVQPDLFIRLRPGKEETVMQKLTQAGIQFNVVTETCLALPNTTKVDEIIEPDSEAVIQDYNSQKTLEILPGEVSTSGSRISVWDCCAASGGKSIMAKDILGDIDLVVSDVRETILLNLKKRFANAGINHYKSFVADLSVPLKAKRPAPVDLIIADVPCSGSGTWSRTPEQLYFFEERKIEEYAALQRKIIGNALKYLQPGGYLLYITCSVFAKENEEAIEFIRGEMGLSLVKMEVLKGYDKKADTLFVALLKKSL